MPLFLEKLLDPGLHVCRRTSIHSSSLLKAIFSTPEAEQEGAHSEQTCTLSEIQPLTQCQILERPFERALSQLSCSPLTGYYTLQYRIYCLELRTCKVTVSLALRPLTIFPFVVGLSVTKAL